MRNAMGWVGTVAMVASLMLGGCAEDDFSLGREKKKDTYLQSAVVRGDVLFVVDNSGSMQAAQEKVVQAFQEFTEALEGANSEFHLGVTTTDVSDTGAQGRMISATDSLSGEDVHFVTWEMPNYQEIFVEMVESLGTAGNSYEAGLEAAASALLPQAAGGVSDLDNAGFLREDAKLAIIWLSDEDDCSQDGTLPLLDPKECYYAEYASSLVPVSDYVNVYLSIKHRDEDVALGAIVGVPESEACGDVKVAVGDRYISAVNMVGGAIGDVCSGNFSDIMITLGLSAAGQRTVFVLSKTPDPTTIEVYVTLKDGAPEQITEGWTYLEESNAVSFYGSAVPPRDSTIEIYYEVVGH